jgi:predicted nucleotidyltransferase
MESANIRAKVLAHAISSLSALDGVEAIYLSGSLAENTEDQYSDIDLRVVVADRSYEAVRSLREQLPKTWGPFLFHATVAEVHTVSYYDSLTKADVFYYAAGAVIPSPWFNLGTRVLLDRTTHLTAVLGLSKGLTFTAASDDIARHLKTAIAALAEGAKRVRRGERIYAARLCAEGVHHILIADDLLASRAPFGSSKRERVPGDLTEAARSSIGAPAIGDSPAYFAALSALMRRLVFQGEREGHFDCQMTSRLIDAVDQIIALAKVSPS